MDVTQAYPMWSSSHRASDSSLIFRVHCFAKEEVVTDPVDINASWSQRTGLTSTAIFQLWKAALKDDENLLDEAIAAVHEQMMTLNQPRAERVMVLIIRRHRDAKEAFKAMLVATRSQDRPPAETRSIQPLRTADNTP
jgi:hypothetical protein